MMITQITEGHDPDTEQTAERSLGPIHEVITSHNIRYIMLIRIVPDHCPSVELGCMEILTQLPPDKWYTVIGVAIQVTFKETAGAN